MVTSREWQLVRRPQGWPTTDDVALVERPVPAPEQLADGQVLIRNTVLWVDPYMRGRMNAEKSYAPPYQLDKPMYGGAIGQVEHSTVPSIPAGSLVRHGRAWREWAVCRADELTVLDPEGDGVPPAAYLGVLAIRCYCPAARQLRIAQPLRLVGEQGGALGVAARRLRGGDPLEGVGEAVDAAHAELERLDQVPVLDPERPRRA